jgi:hypothetical protein
VLGIFSSFGFSSYNLYLRVFYEAHFSLSKSTEFCHKIDHLNIYLIGTSDSRPPPSKSLSGFWDPLH